MAVIPYPQVMGGEWEQIERHLKIACCHCGLAHEVFFKVVKGKLWWCVHVDHKATTKHRAAKDYLCRPKNKTRAKLKSPRS